MSKEEADYNVQVEGLIDDLLELKDQVLTDILEANSLEVHGKVV